ncbi:hypothetical protein [Halomonas llamarensis]|uniref:Uncharacterized protein n=1 Tax=Halomonas llamarensis TaxID=2945104 RepID=A0ABT0SV15_9GAMM|nr:hypothetical protein [Halomonas llamarensis]MCL7931677.1 hypothetical protein [Halomonas llamarensis]
MTLMLNGVEVNDVWLNGIQANELSLDEVVIWKRFPDVVEDFDNWQTKWLAAYGSVQNGPYDFRMGQSSKIESGAFDLSSYTRVKYRVRPTGGGTPSLIFSVYIDGGRVVGTYNSGASNEQWYEGSGYFSGTNGSLIEILNEGNAVALDWLIFES